MLNVLLDIVTFPVRILKKVPNVSLGGFVPLRFALAVVFAFASAACFITASNGHGRFVFSVLGWVLAAAIVDIFAYANAEEKAIEKDENVK